MEITNGCDYPTEDPDEDIRIAELNKNLKYGNHKSADKHEDHLSSAMKKEIQRGWGLILPVDTAKQIPGLELSPMGVIERLGIAETGEYVPKKRITHDLSWPGQITGESVNSRMDKQQFEPIMFGDCLLRIIHYIVHLRKRYPNKKVLIRKEDLKSAY